MSLSKKDRQVRSQSGNVFTRPYTEEIASALRREYGDSRAAIKTIVARTGSNERAVKNWFSGTNGPSGASLIALCQQSEEVFETLLRLARRTTHLRAKKLVEAKEALVKIFVLIEEITD